MSAINLCGRPHKCCPTLVIVGKIIKKYAIVGDDGTTIKFKKSELKILKDVLNEVL